MNKRMQSLLGCALILGVIALAVAGLGHLFRPFETDLAANAIYDFHDLPENSVEVLVYGSSHAWRGLDSMEMYRNYGIGIYNYGCNWQHINTTGLFVKDSLRTQTPKVVLIDTFRAHDPLIDTAMDGEIYYSRFIPDMPEKWTYLRRCFGSSAQRYLSYFVPFVAFHSNWGNLADWSFQDQTEAIDFHATMGYLPTPGVVKVDIGDPTQFEQLPLGEDGLRELDEIVAACREKNVKIIFYTAPWQGIYRYGDAMTAYAAENDCEYFNLFEMMDEVGLDQETDFCDTSHLNESGAKKVANFFGSYIREHYDVMDMRAVPGNLWETAAQEK